MKSVRSGWRRHSFTKPLSFTKERQSLRSRRDRHREKGIHYFRRKSLIEERLARAEMTREEREQERETDVAKSSRLTGNK